MEIASRISRGSQRVPRSDTIACSHECNNARTTFFFHLKHRHNSLLPMQQELIKSYSLTTLGEFQSE